MTIQSASTRKSHLLVRLKLSLGLRKRLGDSYLECMAKVSEVPVSPENCTELWWRRGKFLTIVLHDVKPSWDLRRYKGVCGQLKLRFSKPPVGVQDRDGSLTFLIKGNQFWWVESYQPTSLLQESKMILCTIARGDCLSLQKLQRRHQQALTGTCLWFLRREAHILLKHFRKIK